MKLRGIVFGPAYLDRVVRVDRPMVDPANGPALDQSVSGHWRFIEGTHLELVDPASSLLRIELPFGWNGPRGQVLLDSSLNPGPPFERLVNALDWSENLGGMGAGLAASFGLPLCSAIGSEGDPTSEMIGRMLVEHAIDHRPVRVSGQASDWTLLVSSGPNGDKLAIGFRGCHAGLSVTDFDHELARPCHLRVVAALPNLIAGHLLSWPGARLRVFAPNLRNMLDRDRPVHRFAGSVDVLCCNRLEWESLADREETGWKVSILVVTEGAEGSWARFTLPHGDPGQVRLPAFPRLRSPVDTNRAGEAFASVLVKTLLAEGWDPSAGTVEEALIRRAMLRASAASALVLDLAGFGFPADDQIDAAMSLGVVA